MTVMAESDKTRHSTVCTFKDSHAYSEEREI